MEFKYFVLISVLGVAAALTVPSSEGERVEKGIPTDLSSSFPSSYTGDNSAVNNPSPIPLEEDAPRAKRHLLFKKYKKGKGDESYNYNRQYDYGTVNYQRPREVHYHHHHPYQAPVERPTYVEHQVPNHEYHHYHGGYSGAYGGQGYYTGGYYPAAPPPYHGGYPHYVPTREPATSQKEETPAPVESNTGTGQGNNVDRGQGAAAVNNIAIIHARSGMSHREQNIYPDTSNLSKAFGINFDDFSRSKEEQEQGTD